MEPNSNLPSNPTSSSPTEAPPPALALMSIEEIERISQMNHENKLAQLRGEPAPHQISQDDLVRALRSIRAMRATGSQRPASKKSGTTGTTTKAINLDDF